MGGVVFGWVWAAALHVKWGLAVRREPEVGHRSRVVAAADWLIETVQEGETAIVVTHGLFRRQLGLYLTTVGWTAATRARGYAHWSAWEFAT